MTVRQHFFKFSAAATCRSDDLLETVDDELAGSGHLKVLQVSVDLEGVGGAVNVQAGDHQGLVAGNLQLGDAWRTTPR